MNQKIISNFVWRLLERFGAQGVTLLVTIILARLLAPEVYGTVALVTVLMAILQVFVDSGLGNALIQKKDADDLDFSSVFYFNITICLVLYALLFISAKPIASFYNNQELIPLIRVLGINIVISGVKNVQQAYVSRNLIFKKFFYATLTGIIGSAFVGILMAYKGYGAWAIVTQMLINSTVDTLILWLIVGWRPKLMFSWKRLKTLLSYGWKLLISSLIDTCYNKARELIIGKVYHASDLAYYNKGEQLPSNIVINICTAIDSVLFPTMSLHQDNVEQVKGMTKKAIRVSTFFILPSMVGAAICSDTIIRVLFTEKWISCSMYLKIFCITYAFYPIHTANLNAMKALGKSDVYLKLEVVKKIVGVTFLLISIQHGPWGIAISCLLAGLVSQFINAFPNKSLLNYGYLEQMKDVLPNLVASLLMGIMVYWVGFLQINMYLVFFIQLLVGVNVYFALAKLFNLEGFLYIKRIFKNRGVQK